MMKFWSPFLFLLLMSPPSGSTTYYISDCANGSLGGVGTAGQSPTNPWCADHFTSLLSGTLSPGDTINLCAGSCDGSGSGVLRPAGASLTGYYVGCDGKFAAMVPKSSGTSGSPITLQNFSGEDVIVDGDKNNNALVDDGVDLNYFVSTCSPTAGDNTHDFWVFKNLRIRHYNGTYFQYFRTNTSSNPATDGHLANVTVDGVEMFEGPAGRNFSDAGCTSAGHPWGCCAGSGSGTCDSNYVNHWITGDVYFFGCRIQDESGRAAFGFNIFNGRGNVILRNNKSHHMCGPMTRLTANRAIGSILVEGNEIYNSQDATDDWETSNITYQNNYIHDVGSGIDVEQQAKNIIIQDNVFACLGQYQFTDSWNGRCGVGITVNNGNFANSGEHTWGYQNITIRRNKVYGVANSGINGNLSQGIVFDRTCPSNMKPSSCTGVGAPFKCCAGAGTGPNCPDCSAPANNLIENNMVWNVTTGDNSDNDRACIVVKADKPVTVQNNSTHNCNQYGLTLKGASHVVRNNIFNEGVGNKAVILYTSDAAGSTFQNNNIHDATYSTVVTGECTSPDSCATLSNQRSCSQINSGGQFGAGTSAGNICQATSFVNVSGGATTWNLHLSASDTANVNMGTTGASNDIDKQTRSGAIDIGADEFTSADTTRPKAPVNLKAQ